MCIHFFGTHCICQLQLGWHPVAAVQYTFTHKQYKEQHRQQYSTHLHTNSTQNNTIHLGRVRAVHCLCELHRGIWLTTEGKNGKKISQDSRRVPVGTMKTIVGIEGECCTYLITMTKHIFGSVISGFRRKVDEICALLGYFGTARQSNLQGSCISWPVKMGPIRWPKTSVRNYHYTLCNFPAENIFHTR